MFHLDEDKEVIPPIHDSTSRYYEPENGLWWPTPNTSQIRTIEDHPSLPTFSNFQPDSRDAFSFPYTSSPLPLADHLDGYPFISSTEDEGDISGTSKVIEAQNTISPLLLSKNPSSQRVSKRTRRKSVGSSLVQGNAFHPYLSRGASVSSLVDDTASSYASPFDPRDLTKERRRHYTTTGQHLNMEGVIPNQPPKTDISTTVRYTETEHGFSPPITSFSLLPHSLRGISTISDDGASSGYSAISTINEREVLSSTDPVQLHSWVHNLPLELRRCYDEFITHLYMGESIENCQKILAPFSIVIMEEVEEGNSPLSTNGQMDEGGCSEVADGDTEAGIPTDLTAEGREPGGVESRESHGSPPKRRRYIGRQCRLCSHKLRHQLQMHQHVMDHFEIYPFHCQKEGCSFSSTRKADLAKHIADQHEMKGVSTCSYCHEVLKHKRNLLRHIKNKHLDASTGVMASASAST